MMQRTEFSKFHGSTVIALLGMPIFGCFALARPVEHASVIFFLLAMGSIATIPFLQYKIAFNDHAIRMWQLGRGETVIYWSDIDGFQVTWNNRLKIFTADQKQSITISLLTDGYYETLFKFWEKRPDLWKRVNKKMLWRKVYWQAGFVFLCFLCIVTGLLGIFFISFLWWLFLIMFITGCAGMYIALSIVHGVKLTDQTIVLQAVLKQHPIPISKMRGIEFEAVLTEGSQVLLDHGRVTNLSIYLQNPILFWAILNHVNKHMIAMGKPEIKQIISLLPPPAVAA